MVNMRGVLKSLHKLESSVLDYYPSETAVIETRIFLAANGSQISLLACTVVRCGQASTLEDGRVALFIFDDVHAFPPPNLADTEGCGGSLRCKLGLSVNVPTQPLITADFIQPPHW